MTKENMINYVASNIKSYLPGEYQDAEVDVLSVTKLNRSYTGLSVRKPEESIVPTINLDQALENISNEMDLKKVMEMMVKELLESERPDFDMNIVREYALAKENLFMKVVSVETNAESLDSIPHVIIEDLAITFHVMLKNDSDQVTSVAVRNEMLDIWGISIETLITDTLANVERIMPSKICSLAEMIGLMGVFVPEENPLVICTNIQGSYGAAALFYPGVQAKLAKQVGGNYYVLPSSCHEVLILPEKECQVPASELKAMVTEINATQVAPEEKLTDSVYYYNAEAQMLIKVA